VKRDVPLLVGNSPEMQTLKDEIRRIARSEAKVLITGESGSGKEQVALSIHVFSRRAERPLVPVNCAGIPETLLESELFGHVRGSFTGAYRDKVGKLEAANGGTVFLDEIGEMTLRMQGLLLRFLETGEVQKVGSERAAAALDVRVVAATNRDLGDLVRRGQFREDLYYRLNVIHVHVPPLRDRPQDIPLLFAHFLNKLDREGEPLQVTPEAMEALTSYRWPGNVRELVNIVERLVVTVRGIKHLIELDDLPATVRDFSQVESAHGRITSRESEIDDLYQRLVSGRVAFWSGVSVPFSQHDMKRSELRALIARGLQETRGSYKLLLELFGMPLSDYKRFLAFLKKHDCHVPFQAFRRISAVDDGARAEARGTSEH